MDSKVSDCIREYFLNYYKGGGLIGISDLSDYCKESHGVVYTNLFYLQSKGELRILKRYFCPEFHWIKPINSFKTYCEECDLKYPNDQLQVAIYIKPNNNENSNANE